MDDVSYLQSGTNDDVQDLADLTGGFLVSGVSRLVQRVVLELLTEQGTLTYQPTRGTPFLTMLKTQLFSELDVLAAFAASKPVLRTNLQGEERPWDVASERYSTCSIDQVLISAAAVQLRLSIVSLSGETTSAVLPVLVFTA